MLSLFSVSSFSQDELKDIASVSAGGGVLTFSGDIGKGKNVSAYTYIKSGYLLNIEKRFAKNFVGASLNIMLGKLAMAERSTEVTRNRNFESSLTQFGVNLTGYLQNKKDIPLVPYLTTGFSFASLGAKTDIKYSGDSLYYYWTDGSIRNLPELPGNEFAAQHVVRDYIYESKLDSAASSAMALPLGIGVKIRMNRNIEANLGATLHLVFADDIDAVIASGNDKYLFSYFSLTYNITQRSKDVREKEKAASGVFASLEKQDSDKDGVNDNADLCPGTPKGAKIDSKGCPLDTDEDGVPDYADKEPNTKKGSIVDAEGKTLTDAMILEKALRDSIASERIKIFINEPSLTALKKFDTEIKQKKQTSGASAKIPARFLSADKNHDGIISSIEIAAIIDEFFEGTNDYTVEKIHDLIDFFFEQ